MAKITVTTNDGEVVEIIDLNEINLKKKFAKSFLWVAILDAVERVERIESGRNKKRIEK